MAGVASVRRARRKAGVGKCMIGWERWGGDVERVEDGGMFWGWGG